VKTPETPIGLIVSASGHAALLAWGLFSFAINPLDARPQDSMPVDIISDKQFSELTKGAANAQKKDEPPKPLVDKIGEEKPAPEQTAKVSEKTEIKTSAAPEPPPVPQPKPQEAKPEPQKKPPPPKVDEIAEALKKEQQQKKAAEAKAKAEQRRKQEQQPKFDANQIAALLDKRNPQRIASTGADLNSQATLGRPDAVAMRMSANELDAMRARLMQLWSPPAGVQNPEQLVVRVRIQLTRDGKLSGNPQVVSRGNGTLYEAARESALRAVFRGQPYDMLSPANYEIWKDVEITFDPREMFRG
jgi:outer membrane biosynthesis protein TonB